MTASMSRLASTTAVIRRNAIDETGRSAGMETVATAVAVTVPVPVGGGPLTSDGVTNAPQRAYTMQVYGSQDVRYGDHVVVGGVTYEVIEVAPHPAPRNVAGQHTSLTVQERLTQ